MYFTDTPTPPVPRISSWHRKGISSACENLHPQNTILFRWSSVHSSTSMPLPWAGETASKGESRSLSQPVQFFASNETSQWGTSWDTMTKAASSCFWQWSVLDAPVEGTRNPLVNNPRTSTSGKKIKGSFLSLLFSASSQKSSLT